ncbi:hypothetical protein SAMN02949497_4625 [Methylomagnum ishizawai]|uniref:Uncharacterized protein n=1 Tax=Methylomagnum ishizawai TaxID=1760988 RepID=A0A1Y6D3M7_9GAMM|nr:hypothetical protein [Methylomagnum ishizawai]SMF97206.1 hypothetical protein SAMN02949497_4625 [Methylomagnum ishizawai]
MSTTSPMPIQPLHVPSHFLHTCGFCGCVFRVELTWCASHSYKLNQNTLPYACPECQRHSRIKTSSEPQVVLVSKRTDGRTSQCPAIE